MVTLFLIKEARIYNGEKTASSVSGVGKTGQLHGPNLITPFGSREFSLADGRRRIQKDSKHKKDLRHHCWL